MTALLRKRNCFESLDELSEAAIQLGWRSELLQLDTGSALSTIDYMLTPRAVLCRFGFNNRAHQLATPLEGYRTFGLLCKSQVPTTFSGQCMDTSVLSYMNPVTGLDAVSEAGFDAITLALREDLLEETATQHDMVHPEDKAWRWNEQIVLSAQVPVAALRQMLIGWLTGPELEEVDIEALESELALRILALSSDDLAGPIASVSARRRIRSRALEFIRVHQQSSPTVAEVCDAASCSISTLERTFREEFGVSPKQYLVRNRLAGAHRSLLNPQMASSTIAHIASDWGFSHMSQFAADYHKVYGELPSRTKRRALKRSFFQAFN